MPTPAAFSLTFSDPGTSAATAQTISVGQTVYGDLETLGDRDWYRVTLEAGQDYVFRLLGVGFDVLEDPELFLRNANGTILSQNDDFGGDFSRNSSLAFTPGSSGVYYIDAGGFSNLEDGRFVLTAVEEDPAGLVLTADEIAWQLTNNFERAFSGQVRNLSAEAHTLSASRTVTYDSDGLTSAGRNLAEQALQMWGDITDITFVESGITSQIIFDDSDGGTTAYNQNILGGEGVIARSNLQVTTGWLAQFGTGYNSYSFETYMHELGHALGLGHGGNYNGSAFYGTDNFYLNDGMHLSIMSYMQSSNDEFQGFGVNTFVNASFRWMLTPAIADILAMENLYGLSTTTRTGNTTYGYDSNTGNAVLDRLTTLNSPGTEDYVAFTLFDNGGIDTINLSGFSGDQRIDLREGQLSDVLGGRLNMGVAYGTVIEQAVGGAGDDTLIGNDAANRLNGGSGADWMEGGLGNDTYVVSSASDVVVEAVSGGIDTVETSRNYTLGAGVERLVLTGAGLSGYGNSLANRLTGTESDDILRGQGGADTLLGEGGVDTLWGGAGGDALVGASGRDIAYYLDAGSGITASLANAALNTGEAAGDSYVSVEDLTGTNHDDILNGLAGARNNTLKGGGGDDRLKGYSGADRLYGNDGNDFLEGGIDGDLLVGGGGRDAATYQFAATGVSVSLTAPGTNTGDAAGDKFYTIEDLIGSAHDDVLEGNTGTNHLTGGAGEDSFVFRSVGALDLILDFKAGQDQISLYSSGFSGLSSGPLASNAFRASANGASGDGGDRILYSEGSGNLFYDPDGTGGQSAQLFARLDPGLALTASDFFVIG